jgi:hypothetical protein
MQSFLGVLVAILGNLCISVALNIQKYVHNSIKDGLLISTEPTSYTSKPLWWLGIAVMAIGELGNFIAYSLAPAILVIPLGTVALVNST